MEYQDLFARNFGVLTPAEQATIRRGRILIVGCGGIGGTVAVALARSGVEHFTLVEFDVYTASNMNRQVACFAHTMGRNKAEVLAECIRAINPQASVTAFARKLDHSELEPYVLESDVVFPAADDFAFSIMLFRTAQSLGRPSLLIIPAGAWAAVSMVMPRGPRAELIGGCPFMKTYEELHRHMESTAYRLGLSFYRSCGGFSRGYYRGFVEGELPPAQLCPVVWIASSLGAMEVIKTLTGRWKPVRLPRYWEIRPGRISRNHLWGPNGMTLRRVRNLVCGRLLATPLRFPVEAIIRLWCRLLGVSGR